MFKTLALAATVAAAATGVQAALSESEYQYVFSKWMAASDKTYTSDTFFYRYNVFKANLDFITEYNANATDSVVLGMNDFGDMTFDEFHATHTGYNQKKNDYIRSKNTVAAAPKISQVASSNPSLDWRQKGAVTPVKNQGQCGSCWSFSATGSMEGAWAIAGNTLIGLSEQQLMDCSQAQGNSGCNGGLMDQAFEYVIQNGGICSEAAYSYKAVDSQCLASTCSSVAHISSYNDVQTLSDTALMTAVNVGPVSIAIQANQQAFQFYQGGVFTAACGTELDHGVLVVGYGTDTTGKTPEPYWIVKNSWGATWGEAGYIRLVRGKDECGMDMEPSYPVV